MSSSRYSHRKAPSPLPWPWHARTPHRTPHPGRYGAGCDGHLPQGDDFAYDIWPGRAGRPKGAVLRPRWLRAQVIGEGAAGAMWREAMPATVARDGHRATAQARPPGGSDCHIDQQARRSTRHAACVIRANPSLARTYEPNVVGEIVSLGKVTITAGAVASGVRRWVRPGRWARSGERLRGERGIRSVASRTG